MVIEMSIKKGNGIYIVDRPLIAEAIITRLIQNSSESQSTRVPPRGKQNTDQKHRGNGATRSFNEQTNRSPYDILDIPPNADAESIKLAYRKMAKLYHPDKVASLAPEFKQLAEQRMKEINAAFQQLMR